MECIGLTSPNSLSLFLRPSQIVIRAPTFIPTPTSHKLENLKFSRSNKQPLGPEIPKSHPYSSQEFLDSFPFKFSKDVYDFTDEVLVFYGSFEMQLIQQYRKSISFKLEDMLWHSAVQIKHKTLPYKLKKLEKKGKASKESGSLGSIVKLARLTYRARGKKEKEKRFSDGKKNGKKRDPNEVKRQFQQIFEKAQEVALDRRARNKMLGKPIKSSVVIGSADLLTAIYAKFIGSDVTVKEVSC